MGSLPMDIFVAEPGITFDMQNVLWLPPEDRATSVAVSDIVLVLGDASARFSFMQFRSPDSAAKSLAIFPNPPESEAHFNRFISM